MHNNKRQYKKFMLNLFKEINQKKCFNMALIVRVEYKVEDKDKKKENLFQFGLNILGREYHNSESVQ